MRRFLVLPWLMPVQAAIAQCPPVFMGIGVLPGGISGSGSSAISADGSTIIGVSSSDRGWEAFRWTSKTGMVGIGDLPGSLFSSRASAVNADGSVVVGTGWSASGIEAFRWTQADGMTPLGDLKGGGFLSEAFGVSDDGSVIVGRGESALGTEASYWIHGKGPYGLGDLAGGEYTSVARAVSSDGNTIAGLGVSEDLDGDGYDTTEALLWNSGIPKSIGDLPGGIVASSATAISDDGSAVVGGSHTDDGNGDGVSDYVAFIWTEGEGIRELGDLPDGLRETYADDLSGDGSIVVGYAVRANPLESVAVVWRDGKPAEPIKGILEETHGIDLRGWQLTDANGISRDGTTIVGTGVNPSGQIESWIARLPAPSCNSADLASPYGILDFTDILAFLTSFSSQCTHADLAPPMGVWDLSDVTEFLQSFAQGCPGE